MLPTKGYFQAIECPYYENACTRPYCHFMHRRKTQEPADEPLLLVKEPEIPAPIPTYKPTPKSELANIKSHIPISYVPDLAFRPDSSRKINRTIPKFSFERPVPTPTYNPTPLSILSSANTSSKSSDEDSNETKATIQEIKLNIASVEYNPADVSLSDDLSGDINFEDLSAEFDLIDDIIDDSDGLGKVIEESDGLGKVIEDSERLKKEIEEITEEVATKAEEVATKTEEVATKDTQSSNGKKTSSKSKESRSSSKKDEKKKSDKEKTEKSKAQSKSGSSHHKSSRSSKDSKSGSGKDSKDIKDSKDKKEEKEKSSKNESSSDEKSRHKHKSSSSKEKKHQHKSSKSSSSNSSNKKHEKHKESSSKEKEREKKKSKERDKHRKEHKKKVEVKVESDGDDEVIDNFDYNEFEEEDDEEDDTMLECYKIFNEYKAPEVQYSEEPTNIRKSIEEDTSSDANFGKKRIAHGSATETYKPSASKPIMQPSPAMVMANRFKVARASQGSNEQNNIVNALKRAPPSLIEHARQTKLRKLEEDAGNKLTMFRHKLDSTRPKVEPPKPKPAPKPESNLVDSILNGSKLKMGGGARRIAPVQNVYSIQREKAKIDEINKRKAAELLKTPAQTTKGAKRTAHVPEISLSDIPDVLSADKSKLPVNVRTRFLTMMADECIKLYLIKEDAYNRALNEEFACYEKCKVLATYRNSAMLAVNRIRKEVQERDKLGLGALGPGETTTNNTNHLGGKKFYDNIKKYILTSEDLDTHGYPKQSSHKGLAVIKNRKTSLYHLDENQRKCSRCNKIYMVDDDGFVLYEQECIYHPLKKRTLRGESIYLCCKSNDETGCATSHTHVSEMSEEAELEGYQMTMEPTSDDDPRSYAVYALDCEMCYTIKGLELTRVTVVDSECKTVYESLVKPLNPIIDYNTNFSGIVKEQMDKTSTNILQVQANILHLCNSQTILIGHSLESDMKALKIIHGTIIDTSVMFPHKMGLPHKKALRTLASEYLRKIIQNSVSGHDSAEDAVTCMELIKWKVKEELKVRGVK